MAKLTMSYWPLDTSSPVAETTVGGVLRAAAAAAPDQVAMVAGVADVAARRRWTYAELLSEAERVAVALAARFDMASERASPQSARVGHRRVRRR